MSWPLSPVLARFSSVAHHHSQRTALREPGRQLSYAQLAARVESEADRLRADGFGPGSLRRIERPRSIDFVIELLAVWQAGGAFLPLDPSTPQERRDAIWTEASSIDPGEAAYLIYTSGSTGRPKGVRVGHGGLLPVLDAQIEAFALAPGKRALWLLSPAFDASLSDIGTALLSGATLCIPPADLTPRALVDYIASEGITHADLPPSLLPLLGLLPSCMEVLVIGGEVCAPDAVRFHARRMRVINVYGPTEATICTSLGDCDAQTWSRPLLGHPLPHVRYQVVSESGHEVAEGETGELLISGPALALGYVNQPTLETARFQEHQGERCYHTGDRVRRLPGGEFEFIGRLDRQIKLRGQLIAPEEIEARIMDHPAVREVVVLSLQRERPDRAPRLSLLAFVVLRSALDLEDLRGYLRRHLPRAHCPRLVQVEALPRGSNGKIDLARLRRDLTPPAPSPWRAEGEERGEERERPHPPGPLSLAGRGGAQRREGPHPPGPLSLAGEGEKRETESKRGGERAAEERGREGNSERETDPLPAPCSSPSARQGEGARGVRSPLSFSSPSARQGEGAGGVRSPLYLLPAPPLLRGRGGRGGEVFRHLFEKILGLDGIEDDDDFFELGGDSISALELIAEAEKQGFWLPADALYLTPTPRALAEVVSTEERSTKDLLRLLSPKPEKASTRAASKVGGEVFLTGATGFLGAWLLAELLERTDVSAVHVLVRASDRLSARKRVEGALAAIGKDAPSHRVEVWPGDIEVDGFGLSAGEWRNLVARVDTILHGAARVHLLAPLRELYAPNVRACEHVLRMQQEGRPKRLIPISTLSVLVSTDHPATLMDERLDPEDVENVYGGYAQSKWLAEALLRRQGHPQVIRPGLLTGASTTGRSSSTCQLAHLLRGLAELGCIPRGEHDELRVDVTPVDHAARVISRLLDSEDGAYHVASRRGATLSQLVSALRAEGWRCEEVSPDEFYRRALECGTWSTSMAVMALGRLLGRRRRAADLFQMTGRELDCTRAETASGLPAPEIDEILLRRYVKSACEGLTGGKS